MTLPQSNFAASLLTMTFSWSFEKNESLALMFAGLRPLPVECVTLIAAFWVAVWLRMMFLSSALDVLS